MINDLEWNTTPFLSIDTETTGFSKNDRICEIAILVCKGDEILETFHTLVDPECWIGESASKVHGITNDDIHGKPRFDEIKDKVLSYLCRDIPWVAHQLNFDTRMLSYVISRDEWPRGIPTLCTMEFAKREHPSLKLRSNHRLLDVAGSLQINYDPAYAHGALEDAKLLAKIVPRLMQNRPVRSYYTRMSEAWLK